jgi:hypothetical protein
MHLKYLGGKTDYKKYVHVFFVTQFAKLDGWLPKEDKIDEWLKQETGVYVEPTLWGYHIYEVVSV